MKPFRLLREQMEARRRAEGKTVEIFLEQPYGLRKSEATLRQFIESHEMEDLNERLRQAQALMPGPDQAREMLARVADIKSEFYDSMGSLNPRVSAIMLRTAVELRYRIVSPQGIRVEIPRKGPDKTKPGVWWGEIIEMIEDYPATIDVPVAVAQWLVATWFDEKVQNGLPAEVQAWANLFEKEMERVQAALEGKPA